MVGIALGMLAAAMILFAGCTKNDSAPAPADDTGPATMAEAGHETPPPPPEAEKPKPTPSDLPTADPNRIIPSGPGGMAGRPAAEVMKLVEEKVTTAEDLPKFFSSSVFDNPELERLPINENSVIADIGAGTGALEVYLLLHKMPFKKIYAVDTDEPSIELGKAILERYFPESAGKIEWVHSEYEDVKLPADSIDLGILINAHFFVPSLVKEPYKLNIARQCLTTVGRALKPDGEVYVYQNIYIAGKPAHTFREIDPPLLDEAVDEMGQQFKTAGFDIKSKDAMETCECAFFRLGKYGK
ncbi:MAG: class I SAM-dependent methyltransferase [Deltaproteobacteria bacterium]|nr:class I SAM-dependent methyltransferase [Deltaproteobacteria bacterium]MCB9487811.1 class I SAM-dependent methyltransferase [Deltaproteobacteria bacterium]